MSDDANATAATTLATPLSTGSDGDDANADTAGAALATRLSTASDSDDANGATAATTLATPQITSAPAAKAVSDDDGGDAGESEAEDAEDADEAATNADATEADAGANGVGAARSTASVGSARSAANLGAARTTTSATAEPSAGARPHIVLMVADDADSSDVALLRQTAGGGTIRSSLTPNLDSIGRRGAVFANAHAAAPLCAPSRFAILTGLRPQCAHTATALRAAAAAAASAAAGASLPPSVSYDTAPRPSRHPTIGHRLSAIGYATGMVGLWHLGLPEPTSKSRELRRVEDTAVDKFGVAAGGKVKRTVLAEYANLQEHVKRVGGFEQAERVYAAPLDADGVLLPKGMKVHNVEWVADGAAKFIQDKGSPSSRPFFLYVGWTLPHGPDADRSLKEATMAFTPAGNWKMRAPLSSSTRATRKEVRTRAAAAGEAGAAGGGSDGSATPHYTAGHQGHRDYSLALSWLDRGVGTVLWALQRRGIMHNTLLTFMSDHGSTDKGHCFSRGTLTPLLIQWPDLVRPGSWVSEPTSLLDVAATLLHAALDASNTTLFASPGSLAPPSSGLAVAPRLHGISLLGQMRPQLRTQYLNFGGRPPPPPPPDYAAGRKLICEAGHTRSLVTGTYRYIFAPQVRKSTAEAYGAAGRHPGILSIEQLYDLATDPNEEKELIQAYSLIASSLVQQTPLTGHREIAAAEALGSFRRAMQRDLADVAVTCGV